MLLYAAILVFSLYYFYQLWRRSKLPPGPPPVHIIGNLPQLGFYVWSEGSLPKALRKFKKSYGDIFTLWIGPIPTVHIGSFELAHEVMIKQGHDFSNRWAPVLFRYINNNLGISMSNGEYWVDQRRFALHTLRNFGVGRNLIEERIMMEFDISCSKLDELRRLNKEDEFDFKTSCDLMIGNTMSRMLFGERFTKESEEEFFMLKKCLEFTLERIGFMEIYVKEWMLKVPFIKAYYDQFLVPVEKQCDFLRKKVTQRLNAINNGEHIITDEGTDFVDAYLKKMGDEKHNPNTAFTEESLIMSLLDIWSAGQDSTTTTILWAFTYLLNAPEKAEKAREEIHSVTQQSRSLSLKDRKETPYFNAILHEVQRQASIVTLNLYRLPSKTTNVGPYVIDPDVPITAEISLIMSDEKDFKNTEQFYPERYFETDKLEQKVIPFGIGKRACPGESLARAELYLIIGNLLAKYHMEAEGEIPSVLPTNNSGIVRKPNSYRMKLTPILPTD